MIEDEGSRLRCLIMCRPEAALHITYILHLVRRLWLDSYIIVYARGVACKATLAALTAAAAVTPPTDWARLTEPSRS